MPRESKTAKIERVGRIVGALRARYPGAGTALEFGDAWELLVATMLSAQCTDEKVNEVTRDLFRKYRGVADYAAADLAALEQDVYSTGFYQKKAKAIKQSAEVVVAQFGGALPDTMDDLLTLPGVARKTANLVLGGAYGKAAGIVVDTHVARLALRMGLTPRQQVKTVNTDRIEADLMALIPEADWIFTGFALILHGRETCAAKKALCEGCSVADHCPRVGVK